MLANREEVEVPKEKCSSSRGVVVDELEIYLDLEGKVVEEVVRHSMVVEVVKDDVEEVHLDK